jgi:hypothetical protein
MDSDGVVATRKKSLATRIAESPKINGPDVELRVVRKHVSLYGAQPIYLVSPGREFQMRKAKQVALYVWVSTDHQSVETQARELKVAERRGWTVVEVYRDAGISGAKGRDQRPGLAAMYAAGILRRRCHKFVRRLVQRHSPTRSAYRKLTGVRSLSAYQFSEFRR